MPAVTSASTPRDSYITRVTVQSVGRCALVRQKNVGSASPSVPFAASPEARVREDRSDDLRLPRKSLRIEGEI